MEALSHEVEDVPLGSRPGFEEELAKSGQLNIDMPELPEIKSKNREEVLRLFRDYFVELVNFSDHIPERRFKVKTKLSKAQDGLLAGVRLQVLDLSNPQNGWIRSEQRRVELEKCAKELKDMFQEMRLLDSSLRVEDEMSPYQIDIQLSERKREQVHTLNALMIKIVNILEAELKMNERVN